MLNVLPRTSVLLVVAASLTACGGGGSTPVNPNPQIQGLASQSIPQDTTLGPVAFTVTDADSGANRVVVTAASSDPSIVPGESIVFAGSSGARTLQAMPAADAVGSTDVTVRAVDPDGNSASVTIRIHVNAVPASFLDVATTTFSVDENGSQRTLTGMTLTPDADDQPGAFDTLLGE